jgi:hypothetical protein
MLRSFVSLGKKCPVPMKLKTDWHPEHFMNRRTPLPWQGTKLSPIHVLLQSIETVYFVAENSLSCGWLTHRTEQLFMYGYFRIYATVVFQRKLYRVTKHNCPFYPCISSPPSQCSTYLSPCLSRLVSMQFALKQVLLIETDLSWWCFLSSYTMRNAFIWFEVFMEVEIRVGC